jgi:hypothetical protein
MEHDGIGKYRGCARLGRFCASRVGNSVGTCTIRQKLGGKHVLDRVSTLCLSSPSLKPAYPLARGRNHCTEWIAKLLEYDQT